MTFPYHFKKEKPMKKIIIILGVMAATLQGCIIKSIYPFFKQEDVVYKNELIGNWSDGDGNSWTIHENPFRPHSYEMHCTRDSRDVAFAANLFTLEGNLYLDLFPVSDNKEEMLVFDLHLVPTHSVAIVEHLSAADVTIRWFDETWLQSMFNRNRIRISHEKIMDSDLKPDGDDGMYLLTASTDELQKFIVKYRSEAMASTENAVELNLTRQ
jgi:hypothetical protein